MSVHYKFKTSLDYDTISFDGLHISVADLKKEIVNKKKLGKTQDFDLQITNAQTKEEYGEDSSLIPKNTSLIIARVPLATRLTKKSWDPVAEKAAASVSSREKKNADSQAANIDLTLMNGTEEEKISAMIKQSTMDYDPRNYQKVRFLPQTGEVPSSYRCHKCNKMGHWIKNCPLNANSESSHIEVKRSTGIPRSFIDAGNNSATEPVNVPPMEKKQEIPDDLICSICKELFTDAVMIPCCGTSFCDECVRTALLESEENECPECHEHGSSPGSLIPNRFLRTSVNSFKNETGYNKPIQPKKVITTVDETAHSQGEEVTPKTPPYSNQAAPSEGTANAAEDTKSNQAEAQTSREDAKDDASPERATSHAGSGHEESDFEDNIIVTVPKPQTHSYTDYRDRQNLNGRYNRSTNEPEAAPSHSSQYEEKEPYSSNEMISKHNADMNVNMRYGMQQHQPHPQIMQQQMSHRQPMPAQMPPNHFHQNSGGGPNPWWNHPNRYGHSMPGVHQKDNMKPNEPEMHSHQQMGQLHHRSYPPMPHQPGPPLQHRGYVPMQHQPPPQMHHRPMMHIESNMVASAFQGVASKIGTGIIEDPLAAFEEIMKEKERRKQERRAAIDSPPRRRSRSGDRRRSPIDRCSPRHTSSDSRGRGRSTGKGERSSSRNRDRRSDKRGRSPDRRRTPVDRRRRRSGSYHSRQSRSYSRSRSNTPPRRHSRSPQRKRSRTPQDRKSRSRSPSNSTSRNRYREGNRRDFRDREEYRERSSRGRGSYRGRGRGSYYRQDRNAPPHHHQQTSTSAPHTNVPYYDQSMNLINTGIGSNQGGYNEGVYHDAQPNRYRSIPLHSPTTNVHLHGFASQMGHAVQEIHTVDSNHYATEPNQQQSRNHAYDVLPPGVEPPPPGFENETHNQSQPLENRESRSMSRTANDRDPERVERKHQSKSPPSREPTRNKNADNRSQHDRDDKREPTRSVRSKDSEKKEQLRDREKNTREKEKDDEKRERKSRDKKKKKKEEKSVEKKRKKEKKEKREKDSKKSLKTYSRGSSVNEGKAQNSSDSLPSKMVKADNKQGSRGNLSTTPPPQQTNQQEPSQTTNSGKEGNIDLYADIDMGMGHEENNPNDDFAITNSPPRLNRSDSILDLHTTVDFEETDLVDSESETAHTKDDTSTDCTFAIMPELSKWERDEDAIAERCLVESSATDDHAKVTSEVLKRAENAIFARAINAIRPIEIKKICPERQKLYSNETIMEDEKSPLAAQADKPAEDVLQITLLNTEQERSVEIKNNAKQSSNKTPVRSIKERLGKKLNEESRSKSRTPHQKVTKDTARNEKDDREKRRGNRETRESRYSSGSKGRGKSPAQRSDRMKSPERGHRDKDRRRNSSSEYRDNKDSKETKKGGRERNERDSETGRDDYNVEKKRDTERERELHKARLKARIREEERTKAQFDNVQNDQSVYNTSSKEKGSGHSADSRKRSESNSDNRNQSHAYEKKRHDIDESSFEPNYDAHDETAHKAKPTSALDSKSKTKTESRKRSRSYSSSSSSSDSSSDSSTDVEERKKKRKRKHKKQKKSKKSKKKKKTKK